MNGKFVKRMKIQLKVQNLCPPSQFPKLSSAVGPDWSLLSADYSRGPYVWHPWFREFNEHIYQIWQQGCQTQAKLESLNPLFTVSQTLVGDTQVTWPLLIEALAYFAPVWTLDCCCLDWNKPDDTSNSQNLWSPQQQQQADCRLWSQWNPQYPQYSDGRCAFNPQLSILAEKRGTRLVRTLKKKSYKKRQKSHFWLKPLDNRDLVTLLPLIHLIFL